MNRPPLEVADIVRCTGQSFIEHSRKWITWQHQKVLLAITAAAPPRWVDIAISARTADILPSTTVPAQRAPELAPGAGTRVAARLLRARRLHTPAGTGSARIAEQATDLQPAVSRQRRNPAGDRPRPLPPRSRAAYQSAALLVTLPRVLNIHEAISPAPEVTAR
jgi:hypothetical protein